MIRLIVKLGVWLDKRFPERVVVTQAEYDVLVAKVDAVGKNAAHAEALRRVVLELKQLKDEYASLKTSLGLNRAAESLPFDSAYLNDTPVGGQYE